MKGKFLLISFILGCATFSFNYGIGDAINNYPLEITLKASNSYDFLRKGTEKVFPHRKRKFIIVLLEIKNIGTEDLKRIGNLNGVWDNIYILDSEGYKYEPSSSYRYKTADALKTIDLSPEEKTKGQVLFEIPNQARGLSLVYKYEYGHGDKRIKIKFEWKLGDKDKK